MAKFTATFVRTIVQRERVVREIEADDMDAAWNIAGDMAGEFDRSCPDDPESRGEECDGWDPQSIAPGPIDV
jgi:hypothetical protein